MPWPVFLFALNEDFTVPFVVNDQRQWTSSSSKEWILARADKLVCVMTSGQYSFCLLLNADWLIQILEGLAVCKEIVGARESLHGRRKKSARSRLASPIFFVTRLDFPSPLLSAPWVSEDALDLSGGLSFLAEHVVPRGIFPGLIALAPRTCQFDPRWRTSKQRT